MNWYKTRDTKKDWKLLLHNSRCDPGFLTLTLNALIRLDRSVWYIRRYCYYMRGTLTKPDGQTVDFLQHEVKKVNSEKYQRKPHTYEIRGGYLENILKKNSNTTQNLIWHNLYYGRRKKTGIRKHKIIALATNPTLSLHPEAYNVLKELVDFSPKIRRQFQNNG